MLNAATALVVPGNAISAVTSDGENNRATRMPGSSWLSESDRWLRGNQRGVQESH
jgi:hypothetical protein